MSYMQTNPCFLQSSLLLLPWPPNNPACHSLLLLMDKSSWSCSRTKTISTVRKIWSQNPLLCSSDFSVAVKFFAASVLCTSSYMVSSWYMFQLNLLLAEESPNKHACFQWLKRTDWFNSIKGTGFSYLQIGKKKRKIIITKTVNYRN